MNSEEIKLIVSLFALGFSLISLSVSLFDRFSAYLFLRLDHSVVQDVLLIKTTAENKGGPAKKIDYAFVIITPHEIDFLDAARDAIKTSHPEINLKHTNDLPQISSEEIIDGNFILIPMPYYYRENVRVSDEILQYVIPIKVSILDAGKIYDIRFFLGNNHRLHRSVHGALFVS